MTLFCAEAQVGVTLAPQTPPPAQQGHPGGPQQPGPTQHPPHATHSTLHSQA
jgi:hypothetical protein